MTFILAAPLPGLQSTTVLPSPDFSDNEARRASVDIKRSMTGVLYTYVKSNERSKLQYHFTLSRMKALELRAFITSYYRAKIQLTNHKGEVWQGYLTANPFEFTGKEKSSNPGNEETDITIEFDGLRISALAIPAC